MQRRLIPKDEWVCNVLFEQIWIEDSRVIEAKPRDELKPFFQLSFEEHLEKSIWRPRGDCKLMLDLPMKPIRWKPLYISPFLTDRVAGYHHAFGLKSRQGMGQRALGS